MAPAQTSIVWYFFEKTFDKQFVVCNICRKMLKYFGNTSSLKHHVIKKHNEQYLETLNTIQFLEDIRNENASESDSASVVPQTEIDITVIDSDLKSKNMEKSIVWSFIERTSDKKFAVCKLCKQTLKYCGNTSNFKRHMVRKHNDEFRKHKMKDSDSETNPLSVDQESTDDVAMTGSNLDCEINSLPVDLQSTDNVTMTGSNLDCETNPLSVNLQSTDNVTMKGSNLDCETNPLSVDLHSTDDVTMIGNNLHCETNVLFDDLQSTNDLTMTGSNLESRNFGKSTVWTFFDKTSDNKFVVCKLCRQTLKYFLGANSLKHHIVRKHNNEYHKYITNHNNNMIDSPAVNVQNAVNRTIRESHLKTTNFRKSLVWFFFEKTSVEFAVCKLCQQTLKYCGNTTHLKQHAAKRHSDEYNEHIRKNNPNKAGSYLKSGNYGKSIVWFFFEKTSDKKFAVCKLCKQTLKYFLSTSNLKHHIVRKHNNEYHKHIRRYSLNKTGSPFVVPSSTIDLATIGNRLESRTTPGTSSENLESSQSSSNLLSTPEIASQLKLFGGKNSSELSKVMKKQCDLSLLKLILKDFQPLCIVENVGFIEYSAALNPLYEVPSRSVLTNNLLIEQYSEEVEKLNSILCEVQYMSLSIDIWRSDSNISYLFITCHFIHNQRLISRVLSTKKIISEHSTGKNVSTEISNVISDWDIEEKIVTIVSDNGTDIGKEIAENFQHYKHYPCVAHTLNRIIKDSVKGNDQLRDLIKKCKNLVAYFELSDLDIGKLRELQQERELPSLKSKQVVETRWNSTLLVLEKLLEIKSISLSKTGLPSSAPEFIDESEWTIISDCVPILKPIELMTAELLGEKYTTMSTIIPLIRGLQLNLRNVKPTTELGLWLQSKLTEVISRRLGSLETDKVVAKSTFLDPRLKKTAFGLEKNAENTEEWLIEEVAAMVSNAPGSNSNGIGFDEPQLSADFTTTTNDVSLGFHFDEEMKEVTPNTTPAITAIATNISADNSNLKDYDGDAELSLIEEITVITSNSPVNNLDIIVSNDSQSSTETNTTSNNMSLWVHFDEKIKEVATQATPTTAAMFTVQQYLDLPHCNRTSDPLKFWENHRLMLPELYELHKKYGGIPATSLNVRLLCSADQFTNLERNKVSSKHVDAILFLNGCFQD